MKKEIADMWVKSLRSGKYQQSKAALHFNCDDGEKFFCCLGVLCDISKQGEWAQKDKSFPELMCYETATEKVDKVLPDIVREWSGMRTLNGHIDDLTYLSELNDKNYSFEQIAYIIEKYWEIL